MGKLIKGKKVKDIEVQLLINKNVEKGYVKVAEVKNGVLHYSITKKGKAYLKSLKG